MIIMKGTSWDRSNNFYGATGQAAEVLGVTERVGMPDTIIVQIYGTRAEWPRGQTAYVKTKTYDDAGTIFYHYDNEKMRAEGRILVYVKIPYKGNDPGGGLISLSPIVAEQSRNEIDTQTSDGQTLPKKIAGDVAAVEASIGGFMGLSQKQIVIGAVALIAGFIIYKKVLKK